MDFLAFTVVQVNQQSQQYPTTFMFIILCALQYVYTIYICTINISTLLLQ